MNAEVDKLLIHFAQSHIYMQGKEEKDTFGWRFKTGEITEDDVEHIKWAKELLEKLPIYIKAE